MFWPFFISTFCSQEISTVLEKYVKSRMPRADIFQSLKQRIKKKHIHYTWSNREGHTEEREKKKRWDGEGQSLIYSVWSSVSLQMNQNMSAQLGPIGVLGKRWGKKGQLYFWMLSWLQHSHICSSKITTTTKKKKNNKPTAKTKKQTSRN